MKMKKLISCFLSIAISMTLFTAFPVFATDEEFSETVVQTVFELSADDIKNGNVPQYVDINSEILDSENTSDENGVISNVVEEDTNFIRVDLDAAKVALPGEDTGLYTIEVTTNLKDSDDTTKNGTLVYANGTSVSEQAIMRSREGVDFSINRNNWNQMEYKADTSFTVAHYVITDMNIKDGSALSHTAKYDTATASGTYLFSGVAHDSQLSAWSGAPVRGLTIKAGANCRANIKSLKITRKATFTSENYRKKSQTVCQLNIKDIKSGNIPNGITLNTDILDESATSASLVSDTVSANTDFLKLDFEKMSADLPGTGTGLYTVEIVANVKDADDLAKNGTLMYINDTKMSFRARETSDFCVMSDSWGDTAWNVGEIDKISQAHYTIEDLNLTTGAAKKHLAQRELDTGVVAYQYGSTARGGELSEWSGAPITTLTIKAAANYRANIKSLRITRKIFIENATYTVNAITENEAYGTVTATGVSDDEDTKGQVTGGDEVTLSAQANEGYLFKGWYKEGNDMPSSTERDWTFVATESANYIARFVEAYVIDKTVFELDTDSLKAGSVPDGVTFNRSILDSENSSSENGLISNVVSANTAFITIDLDKVGIDEGQMGESIYTIELVTNVNDEDNQTKNGTLMNLKGISDYTVFRARENSDICAMPNKWANLYWQPNTGATASYGMEDLNLKDGSAKAHYAMRDTSPQYEAYANGHALEAGNASEVTPISILTLQAAANYRANIKSLRIIRRTEIPLEYVNAEAVAENDAYGIVTGVGDTAVKYSTLTLNAEPKQGYIFDGWYDDNTLVSKENPWTFKVTEHFSYTAKFRKVNDEWIEVYNMDIADILSGNIADGVGITNLDTINSSSQNGLLSTVTDASQDFMTITFADLKKPQVNSGDVLTDVYRVDMELNLVDDDAQTKNGAVIYYNQAKNQNMLLRVRETRDATVYKNGSDTIYGATVGSQKIPSLAYNFKVDTKTGLLNQYVKHGTGDYYLFGDTASRGDDINLSDVPQKIIIKNADYNSNGVNEDYRVNIKSLTVKRLVRVIDTGNAVPEFSKNRVSVVSSNGEVWIGDKPFTTDIEKIVIDFGSEIHKSQITSDSVYVMCDNKKIDALYSVDTKADGSTVVTLTGMTFENGKSYKIIADNIVNVNGASLHKTDEYVTITTEQKNESVFVNSAKIGESKLLNASDILPNSEISVNVKYLGISNSKDVYVLYVAYKNGTKADVKLAKLEDISGNGTADVKIMTGDVSNIEKADFIIWEGWSTMRILASMGL